MISFLILILGFPVALISQTVEGKVIDESTNEPLAFVNIGMLGTTIGTVSDENGYFTLYTRNQSADAKVRFTMIGYEAKVVELRELLAGFQEVGLAQQRIDLEEITVSKSRLKKVQKGTKTTSKRIVTGWNKNIIGGERGIRIKTDSKPVYVQSLHFHVARNGFEEVLLRAHFRSFKNDKPAQHLTSQSILIPVTGASGWVEVDLEEYNLLFEEDFAVTLQPVQRKGECLEGENCFQLSLSMFKIFSTRWLVYKMSSEAEWEVKKNFSPGIFLTVYE